MRELMGILFALRQTGSVGTLELLNVPNVSVADEINSIFQRARRPKRQNRSTLHYPTTSPKKGIVQSVTIRIKGQVTPVRLLSSVAPRRIAR